MKVLFFIVLALATVALYAEQDFVETCLEAHNVERAELGIAGLSWSEDLAESALNWAKSLARKNTLKHSNNRNRIGENIARRKSRSNSLELLLESWTSEKKYYVHRAYPKCSRTGDKGDVGHYTQIIWQDTTEVGCGFATGFGRDYLVCQYATSGNRQGKYAYDKENTEFVKPVEITKSEVESEEPEEPEEVNVKIEEPEVSSNGKEINVIELGFTPGTKTDTKVEQTKTETKIEETKNGGKIEETKTETKIEETKTEVKPVNSGVSDFAQECLDIHNHERSLVGSPDLVWSEELEARALKWAKELARMGKLQHSNDRVHIGENISYTGTKKDSTKRLLEMWMDERKYYVHKPYPNCSSTGNKSDVGHYTQVIWKDTKELGCAVATSNGKDFMVCQYKTSGNRKGKLAY